MRFSLLTMLYCALFLLLQAPTIRLEAENATLDGPHVESSRAGFSGTGYVTDLTKDKARIVWHLKAKAGIYDAKLGYSASGAKGFEISVNGFRSSGMLPATGDSFGTKDAGKVELKEGDNEVAVERGWGFYDVDYLDLTPAKPPVAVQAVPTHLSDPDATPEAKRLYASLLKNYGQTTLSGQYDGGECQFIEEKTGKVPAILGGDLIDYSPSRVAHETPKDLVPGWIDATGKGQILTLSWHWNAPKDLIDQKEYHTPSGKIEDASWYFGFYTRATNFDVTKALADHNGEDYQLLLRDIDTISVQLKRLQDAHVPVLWRPLHEAEGGWFWWGAKGPEACKKLYHLVYDRLTKHDGIHNLIWVWNSPKLDWYPGDDVVDIMSFDDYPADRRDALSPDWENLFATYNGKKPIALAEFPGAPDVERMRKFGVRFLYFVSWTGSVGPKSTPAEILLSTYDSKFVTNKN